MSVYDFRSSLQDDQQSNSNPYSSHAQSIKKLFLQVTNDLSYFLKHLNSLFYSHGIIFDVTQYHSLLLRMLTPVELLEFFKIKSAIDMLSQSFFEINESMGNMIKKNQKKKSTQPQTHQFSLFKQEKDSNLAKNLSSVGRQQRKELKQMERMKQFQQNINSRQYHEYLKRDDRKLKIKSKAMLQTDQQNQVKQFIIDAVKNGQRLNMGQIAKKAKKVCINRKDSTKFLGSIGWVRHFLKRYPKMRFLYDISRSIRPQDSNKHHQSDEEGQYTSRPVYYRPQQKKQIPTKQYQSQAENQSDSEYGAQYQNYSSQYQQDGGRGSYQLYSKQMQNQNKKQGNSYQHIQSSRQKNQQKLRSNEQEYPNGKQQ